MKHESWLARVGVALCVLLALAGMAISAVLLQHHIVLEVGGDPLLGGVCTATATASCDDVLASRWGMFLGLPTALWGWLFFACLAAWFLVVGRPSPERRWLHRLPLAATAVGTVGCIVLAAIMFGTMKSWCPLCTATHVTTLLLFILTLAIRPRRVVEPASSAPRAGRQAVAEAVGGDRHPPLRLVLVSVLLATMTAGAGWAEYERRRERAYGVEYRQRWEAYESDLAAVYQRFMDQPYHDLPIGPDDPVQGNPDAPHTIVIYSDLLCPWCRTLAHIMDRRMAEYPGRFRMVFRHFPMDKSCNEQIARTLHAGACPAAVVTEAARVAGGPDAFWKMHDAIFAEPARFRQASEQFTREVAQRIGLDVDLFWRQATQSSSTWDRVRANVAEGHRLGLRGTPAIFLNGRKLDRYADDHFWRYLAHLDGAATRPAGFRTTMPASARPTDASAPEPAEPADTATSVAP